MKTYTKPEIVKKEENHSYSSGACGRNYSCGELVRKY